MKTHAMLTAVLALSLAACSGSASTVGHSDGGPDQPSTPTDAHLDGDGSATLDGPPAPDGPRPDRGAASNCPVLPTTFADGKTPSL
ncbi:MAG: hypothetical protein JRH20_21035, partial [Deltaproteobacteria bacterium]|nr:hypothetical protein [Deltaproteobacteria bacterium]